MSQLHRLLRSCREGSSSRRRLIRTVCTREIRLGLARKMFVAGNLEAVEALHGVNTVTLYLSYITHKTNTHRNYRQAASCQGYRAPALKNKKKENPQCKKEQSRRKSRQR